MCSDIRIRGVQGCLSSHSVTTILRDRPQTMELTPTKSVCSCALSRPQTMELPPTKSVSSCALSRPQAVVIPFTWRPESPSSTCGNQVRFTRFLPYKDRYPWLWVVYVVLHAAVLLTLTLVGSYWVAKVVQTTDPTSPHPLTARTSSPPQVAQTSDPIDSRSSQSEVRRDSAAIKVLFDAVERNDPEAVREAINNGSDINGRNATGFTPLHFAAALDHLGALTVLLFAKANKEAANDAGDRPLHLAAANGNSRAAGLLVVAGADLNATAQDGSTPELRAAGHKSTVALLHSLSYFQMGRGRAASDAATKALRDAVERNDPQAVRAAIENGADIEERRGSDGWTALHLAAYNGSIEVSCVLLRAGADKEAVDWYNCRPLHRAVLYGCDGAVALFAVAGADLHSTGRLGRTPLQLAALNGHTSTVALLHVLGG